MRRAAIAGPDFAGFTQSVAAGFREIGWSTETFVWNDIRPSLLTRVHNARRRASETSLERTVNFEEVLAQKVLPALRAAETDLLVVLKPHAASAAVVAAISALGVPIVVWTFDSVERYPGQRTLMEAAAGVFVMDRADEGRSGAIWLPLGYDPQRFNPGRAGAFPRFDVLFIGNVFRERYERRARALKMLRESELARTHRVGFVGAASSRWMNRLGWMPGPVEWLGSALPMDALGGLCAASRICINIHQDDGVEPVNPMFFAIPASGSCEVTDERPQLGHWLRQGVEFVAAGEEGLLRATEELLRDEPRRARIAESGRNAARNHTFAARASLIVDLVTRSRTMGGPIEAEPGGRGGKQE